MSDLDATGAAIAVRWFFETVVRLAGRVSCRLRDDPRAGQDTVTTALPRRGRRPHTVPVRYVHLLGRFFVRGLMAGALKG